MEVIKIKTWEQARYYSNRLEGNVLYNFLVDALKNVQVFKYENPNFEFELRPPYDEWELANCRTIIRRNYLDIPLNTNVRKYVYSALNYFYDKFPQQEIETCIVNVLANEFHVKNYTARTLQTKCPIKFSSQSKKYSIVHNGKILYLIPKNIGELVYNKIENKKIINLI